MDSATLNISIIVKYFNFNVYIFISVSVVHQLKLNSVSIWTFPHFLFEIFFNLMYIYFILKIYIF